MIYREVGQFKASYAADQAIFPISQDRWLALAALVVAYLIIPFIGSDYWLLTIMIPFLVYALAAIGLNLLTGYAGQVSLGTGGFMAVGAFATYKLTTTFPELNIVFALLIAGVITALVGVLFGFPSLRIKGFYLAVATLAAQFFLIWMFNKVPWFYNYSASGEVLVRPDRRRFACAGCQRPGARPHRARLDGDPRHGRRRGNYWHSPAAHEAACLRFELVLLRHRRRYVGLHLYQRGRGQRFRDRALLPDPVHDHHRRSRQHPRLVPWRCFYRAVADFSRQCAAHGRLRDAGQSRKQSAIDDFRRADRLLSDRRAERSGTAMGDRQGEAA